MIIRKSKLRKVIYEVINTWRKNHYTAYDDPFGIEDEYDMDLDVQKYANANGSWSVVIDCGWNDKFTEPLRVFKTENDAEAYSDKKSEIAYRAFLQTKDL
jgi:hypothetical protein